MMKPKIIIVGISNDRDMCRNAIEAVEKLGFETLVVDTRTIIGTPETTMEKIESMGAIYPSHLTYPPSKSKYHK